MTNEYQNYKYLFQALILFLSFGSSAHADFLEMPEIKQTPEMRTRSLLRDMDIPAVKFRSPDPTEGPRLAVTEFRIQGLVEYPKMGITREALKTLSERIRFDLMGEGKLLESGYTIEELGEVSDLLGSIEEETTGRHVEPVDVQRLVWLIREQRGKRGITLGQIETVANTITQFYRERGFVLAKAYVPKQQVRDGIVNLTLLLGMLGDVQVNGNKLYRSNVVSSVFDGMLGKPVTNTAIEEQLFLINDYPGIFVDGYFEPGYQVGDTRLNVTVKQESRFNGNVRLDNHGAEETGLYRAYGDVQWNNPLGLADKLQVSALYASDPSNNDYWQLLYQMKLFGPRTRLGLEISENQYLVDLSTSPNDDINGTVTLTAATGTYVHKRNRKGNHSFDLRYEIIESRVQTGTNPDTNNRYSDKLNNLSLVYRFDALEEEKKRYHQGQAKITSGSFAYGAERDSPTERAQEENYNIYSISYSLLDFWKLPFFNADTRLVYRAEGQYAGINLSGILRFSLSGPTRARAYKPGFFTADDALFVGIDWIFNSPGFMDFNVTKSINLKELMKPFVFVDAAYGQQQVLVINDPETTATLIDAGLGWKFSQGKSFSGNLLVAFPVKERFAPATSEPPIKVEPRLVFDFQYSF